MSQNPEQRVAGETDDNCMPNSDDPRTYPPPAPPLPRSPALVVAWRSLPARVRGLLANIVFTVLLAALTALQTQLAQGHVDGSAVANAALVAFVAGSIQFLHGLGLLQES